MFASRAMLVFLAVLASTQAAAVKSKLTRISTIVKDLRHITYRRFSPPPSDGRAATANAPVDELTMDQILDHFNSFDSRTWKQRYFARADLYKQGGPVFINIGGEGQETSSTLQPNNFFMTYLGEIYKAKLFNLEHRYYGKSHTTADLTTENLQYLSAEQALADLAYFIEYLIEKGDVEKNQKVVVFGGSYSGNLAAWARIKYPHLISAAVSSSAPLLAVADFSECMQVVGRSIKKTAGDKCYDNVKKAFDRISQLIKTADGMKIVKDIFRVSKGLDTKLDKDVFFDMLATPITEAVLNNMEYMGASPHNIKYICSFMEGDLSADDAVKKLAHLVLGKNMDGNQLYDWSYAGHVEQYQNTSYVFSNGEYDSNRQWVYQTCTEFGYFQTFHGTHDVPFPKEYNDLAYSIQLCKDVYGSKYKEEMLYQGIKRTNLAYGERHPNVTNVVFVNGDIDPWHALGINKDVSKQAPAVFVKGGSHCADMDYPNSKHDTKSLIAAHKQINEFVHAALHDSRMSPKSV